jgi:hypothetical protein
MALIIPKSVGGGAVVEPTQAVEPIETRASSLVIPASVGGAPGPALQQQPQPSGGIGDFFTGSERIAATPELGALPEFGATEEGDTFKIAAGLLSTFDEKAQQDIIMQNIPGANFETTADGSVIIEVPTEGGGTRRSVLNRPGISPQDLTTGVAQILSFIPAARLANLGKTVLQKVGLGGVAAGATEQALQETGVALGRQERDPVATGLATVTGGLSEAVVPAIQAVRGARQTARIGAAGEELAQVEGNVLAAREATEATGVPLFQAQQTAIPAQLEKQSFVAQLPAGTQAAVQGLRAQNKAAGDAVENFINTIAPDEAVITGAERFRTAAQSALTKAKDIRREKTSPLFNQAFKEGADVDLKPVNDLIKAELDELPKAGEIAKALNKIQGLIKGKKGAAPTLRLLQNAKLEIDQMLNKVGTDSLGNTTKAKLTQVKSALLAQMDEASPAFQEARNAFAEASPAVTKVQESIIGKIAALDDTQLKQVSSKIFDPQQTNPAVIARAKKAITDVDPDAWNEITRVELERRLGSIKSTLEEGSVENIPGQLFRAIFPNDKGTKVLMNALDDEGKKNLKFLQTALRRASLGRPGGSQTAAREEIKQELRGGIGQGLRNLFSSPINTIVSIGDESAFNRRAASLSKALFDPNWKAEMKALRALNPNSPAAARAMTQLINDIEGTEEQQ